MPDKTSRPRPWSEEVHHFIEAGGNTTHSFGLGRMIGRLYALLYLSPAPLSLEEIAEQLGVSKASVSITVRQLAAWQAVHPVNIPGDRRDFYEAETHFSRILKQGLMPGLRKKLQSAGTQIENTLAAEARLETSPAPGSSAGSPLLTPTQQTELRRRLKAAQSFHRKADRLLGSKLLTKLI